MKREDFRRRQARALRRRFDMTGLTAQQVGYAIGVHADTILNWSRGESTMNGAAIEAVGEFFQSLGDWNFIAEIYGDLGVRRRMRAEQLEKQARQLREDAAWLSGRAAEGAAA